MLSASVSPWLQREVEGSEEMEGYGEVRTMTPQHEWGDEVADAVPLPGCPLFRERLNHAVNVIDTVLENDEGVSAMRTILPR